jgi:pimeloyl-ACP methyl ester carboxylesterase
MIVQGSDVELFCEIRGSGPDVVLLHPFPSTHEYWQKVAPHLESRYRLIMPDLRGHGQSGVGEGPATMRKQADDVVRICDATGVGRAVFIGCSIGCYVIFEIWRQARERVRSMVLTNTKSGSDTDAARAQRLQMATDVGERGPDHAVDAMLAKVVGETTKRNRPDVVSAVRETMNRSTAAGIAAVQRGMAERPDSTPTLATITVPTLVIGGEEDTLCPREEMERIAGGIRGAELKMVQGAGHFCAMERPEEVASLLRGFLDRVAERS